MTAALRASILVIGDEVLGGFVQDTNSGWLAQRLQALGIPLDRIVTVPDDVEAIGEALTGELERATPRVVLTSGGIGSTPDDLTMTALARHLGRELVSDPELDARISATLERTRAQGVTVTDEHATAMRKMAVVPAHARLLSGATGIAPGVAVDVDGGSDAAGATIVVLPGIPGELRRIMTTSVEPAVLAGRGRPDHVVELTHPYPESVLSPLLDHLGAEFPTVHVGSYPARECLVRLKGPKADVEAAEARVRQTLTDMAAQPGAERLAALWERRWSGRPDQRPEPGTGG